MILILWEELLEYSKNDLEFIIKSSGEEDFSKDNEEIQQLLEKRDADMDSEVSGKWFDCARDGSDRINDDDEGEEHELCHGLLLLVKSLFNPHKEGHDMEQDRTSSDIWDWEYLWYNDIQELNNCLWDEQLRLEDKEEQIEIWISLDWRNLVWEWKEKLFNLWDWFELDVLEKILEEEKVDPIFEVIVRLTELKEYVDDGGVMEKEQIEDLYWLLDSSSLAWYWIDELILLVPHDKPDSEQMDKLNDEMKRDTEQDRPDKDLAEQDSR